MRHKLVSAKLRAKSLANNAYYMAIPPHMHHEAVDLIADKPVSTKAMFLHGYKPWVHPSPGKGG